MNIAVAVPEQIKQHQAYKARRARMAAKAWKPVLIEAAKAPPKKQLAQRLKDKTKPVIVGHHNFHVKAYYHHLSWTDAKAQSPEDVSSRLSVSDIQHIIAGNAWELDGVKVEPFEITVKQIKGHRRKREIALVRQVSMFVARQKTDLSFPSIGRHYGGRDHTTVIHAYQKMLKAIAFGQLLMNGKPFNLDRIGEI
jgi:hypothetical protein